MDPPRRVAVGGLLGLLSLSVLAQVNSVTPPTTRPAETAFVMTEDREKRMKVENDAIWAALEKRVDLFELSETPLNVAIEKTLTQTAVRNHHVEWQNLIDAGVPRDKPITLRLRGVPAWRVLDLLLGEAGGADIATAYEPIDGVLHIGSADSIYQHLSVHVYPVGDILSHDLPAMRARASTTQPADEPLPEETADAARAAEHFRNAMKRLEDAAGEAGEEPATENERPRSARVFRLNRLIDLVAQTVHPDCWVQNGGTSTLQVFEDCLVVRSNPKVHREICRLLSDLRAGILETPAESRQRRQRR